MAAYKGRDVAKLKAKGGGKWKYMNEADMLAIAEPFTPYRYVHSCGNFSPSGMHMNIPIVVPFPSEEMHSLAWSSSRNEIARDLADSMCFVTHRSLFMWYMWRVEDVNLDALS